MANNIHSTYTLLGLLLMVSGCSQEEVGKGESRLPGERIEFKASLPEVGSRATEVSFSTLDSFQVSAFTVGDSSETPFFNKKIFRRDSNLRNIYFCEDEDCRWRGSCDSVRFIAFYPSLEMMHAVEGEVDLSGSRLTEFKVARDIASQYDFLTAIAGGSLYYNEETGISVKFQHQFSRIFLKAWGNSQSYDLEIAGVRIGGVGTEAEFNLEAGAGTDEALQGGKWENIGNGYVEYIYRTGDVIVRLDGTESTPNEAGKAVSILGTKIGGDSGYENSAMVIPTANGGWDYKLLPANGERYAAGKYISVLIRVTDDTPYDTNGSLVYPYKDESLAGKTVWLAIDATDGKTVKARLYKNGEDFFSDEALKMRYDFEANGAVAKDFAWAAFPLNEEFLPGRVYTYTLNFTSGVGLRAPNDTDPGTSIISDRVLIDVEVAQWETGTDSGVTVPRK